MPRPPLTIIGSHGTFYPLDTSHREYRIVGGHLTQSLPGHFPFPYTVLSHHYYSMLSGLRASASNPIGF